ncbi:nitroreductase family protein [Vibrio parahaemolyticus]|nr:nitroreductase family protein [Vibrio parahaemolyticus]EIU6824618.1 nitroreductase family protein [Vibrio parahaemolyticus]EJE4707817.1 nitroreductase family protein [Vibrio parahaemolyticus]ELA8125007.1 nitroreductase family protein [Vibrio parahaemolyticus]ELA8144239.1 nitroreductase family protein [Vibrio parahaemolyticus]
MQSVVKKLKKKYWNILRLKDLIVDFQYDFVKFKAYSSTFGLDSGGKLEGKIIAHYHVIEKGFSFKNTKLGFAKPVVLDLISLLKSYDELDLPEYPKQVLHAVLLVERYISFHKKNDYDVSIIEREFEKISHMLISYKEKQSQGLEHLGTKYIHAKDYKESGLKDFKALMEARVTTRQFKEEVISEELLCQVLDIARHTPTACNRQPVRVHVFNGSKNVRKVLKHQNGNRGFGNQIPGIMVVTFDSSLFEGSFERYQGYIDAGLFSMSLMNALHYQGLGYVALNWCATKSQDINFRADVKGIKEEENIVMMIGFGYPDDTIKSPQSKKRKINEFTTYH